MVEADGESQRLCNGEYAEERVLLTNVREHAAALCERDLRVAVEGDGAAELVRSGPARHRIEQSSLATTRGSHHGEHVARVEHAVCRLEHGLALYRHAEAGPLEAGGTRDRAAGAFERANAGLGVHFHRHEPPWTLGLVSRDAALPCLWSAESRCESKQMSGRCVSFLMWFGFSSSGRFRGFLPPGWATKSRRESKQMCHADAFHFMRVA